METTYEKNAKVFKAFCDAKRLAILELLQDGEKCACVLIEKNRHHAVGTVLPHENSLRVRHCRQQTRGQVDTL